MDGPVPPAGAIRRRRTGSPARSRPGCLAGRPDRLALYGALVLAPADYQQGDGFRIIYVTAGGLAVADDLLGHGGAAAVGLITAHQVAHAAAASCATIGAYGSRGVPRDRHALERKPMWGTYWSGTRGSLPAAAP